MSNNNYNNYNNYNNSLENAILLFLNKIESYYDHDPKYDPQIATNHEEIILNHIFEPTSPALQFLTLLRYRFSNITTILCYMCNILFDGNGLYSKVVIKKGLPGLGGSYKNPDIKKILFNGLKDSWNSSQKTPTNRVHRNSNDMFAKKN